MTEVDSFDKVVCPICQIPISKGGAAFTSHLRAHVRKGEALEHKRGNKLAFTSTTNNTYLEQEPYAKLGEEPLPGQPKSVWELPDLSKEFPVLDVSSYFITSGEATKKCQKAVKDAYSLAVKLRGFLKKLETARGEKKFLETARDHGRLLVKGKDPRNKGEVKASTDEVEVEEEG